MLLTRARPVCSFQLERSSDTEVTLRDISDSAAGSYKCEVSGEGPEFWTAFEEHNVSVVGKLSPVIVRRQLSRLVLLKTAEFHSVTNETWCWIRSDQQQTEMASICMIAFMRLRRQCC